MLNVIVTLKSNVEHDSEGNMVLTEENIPKILDPDDIGILSKTHPIMTVSLSKGEDGETLFDSGYTTRCEVFWDKGEKRSPSPAMVAPKDLVWLEVMNDEADGEADDDDDEDEFEQEDLEPVEGEEHE